VPSPAPFHTFETPPRLDPTATRVLDARVQPENPAGVH
jgi:cytochrome c oxidase subunit 1